MITTDMVSHYWLSYCQSEWRRLSIITQVLLVSCHRASCVMSLAVCPAMKLTDCVFQWCHWTWQLYGVIGLAGCVLSCVSLSIHCIVAVSLCGVTLLFVRRGVTLAGCVSVWLWCHVSFRYYLYKNKERGGGNGSGGYTHFLSRGANFSKLRCNLLPRKDLRQNLVRETLEVGCSVLMHLAILWWCWK